MQISSSTNLNAAMCTINISAAQFNEPINQLKPAVTDLLHQSKRQHRRLNTQRRKYGF